MTIATEATRPRSRRLRWLPWFVGFVALMVVWWTQPHFGASVCPLSGFMWETSFVEEVRPTIRSIVSKRAVQLGGELPAGLTVAQFVAVADQAVDLLKECVAERSVNYCRYAGPNPNGAMMHGRTREGPNAIDPKDESKYRYIKTGVDYDISMIPQDAGGSSFRFQVWRSGKTLEAGGTLCYLGCWCNAEYGR
jgi:hypothetical protein